MSKGMRLSKRRLLSCKRPSDNRFGVGGASLLACFGAPFTLLLTSAFHSLSFNQFCMERVLKFNNTLSLTLPRGRELVFTFSACYPSPRREGRIYSIE